MCNKANNVLYVGVTSNLIQRIYQHKNKLVKGFTSKYNLTKLIYFEIFQTPYDAISREKQIKGGSRKKKEELIKKINPEWKDMYDSLL